MSVGADTATCPECAHPWARHNRYPMPDGWPGCGVGVYSTLADGRVRVIRCGCLGVDQSPLVGTVEPVETESELRAAHGDR